MTASLRDYLFTDCEKETRDKVNVTPNKDILSPKKVEISLFHIIFNAFRIRFTENRTPEND